MPHFILNNVTHYNKNTVTLTDFSGKWLVLDFWASFCPPCIASLPRMSELQGKFKKDVQIIMVGLIGKRSHADLESTKRMYERLRRKHRLDLVVAYDSTLSYKLDIWSVPKVIVIDPNGIVRVPNGNHIDSLSLSTIIRGGKMTLRNNRYNAAYEPAKLLDKAPSTSKGPLLFASLLSKHKNERSFWSPLQLFNEGGTCVFRVQAAPLKVLYRYAYVGRSNWQEIGDSLYTTLSPDPILEVKDTTPFSYSWSDTTNNNLYNYSIHTSRCQQFDKKKLMAIMQEDLRRCFGYSVTIERRLLPYWRLVLKSNRYRKKLESKGGIMQYPAAPAAGFSLQNAPISTLLSIIWSFHVGKEPPIIDETQIVNNVDITLNAVLSDLMDVKKALNSNGLDLVHGQKYMNVIVIRD